MKVSSKKIEFVPFELTLEFTSKDEVDKFHALFNSSLIVNSLYLSNLAKDIRIELHTNCSDIDGSVWRNSIEENIKEG